MRRIESTAAAKKRQMVSRNGEFDEGEIERIGGQDEDDEELVEGHDDNSPSSPERWDVLGLGQAMVSLSLSLCCLHIIEHTIKVLALSVCCVLGRFLWSCG